MKTVTSILLAFALWALRLALRARERDFAEAGCDKPPYGTIYRQVYAPGPNGEPHGQKIMYGMRTTLRPREDERITESALMLVQAIQLRDVDISPWVLYKHLVGRDYNESLQIAAEAKYAHVRAEVARGLGNWPEP